VGVERHFTLSLRVFVSITSESVSLRILLNQLLLLTLPHQASESMARQLSNAYRSDDATLLQHNATN
jgi:hypothetical protein